MKTKETLLRPGAELNIIPVMQVEQNSKIDIKSLPDVLPILALRNTVLFPGTIYPTIIGRKKSIQLIEDIEKTDGYFGAVPQLNVEIEDPGIRDLYNYGTVTKIVKTFEMPDGSITAILQS